MKALRGRVFLLALAIIASSQQAAGADAQSSPASDPRRSGFEFMGPSTQAMQKDDALNPGMLWVKDGEALWQK
ncbi:MAG: sulfur oxidation c-type cytochrome SoxA, partial [Pseudomonadota bacterium]